jgi:hypothetical protein
MNNISINVQDLATPALQAQAAKLTPAQITAACGEPMLDLVRRNFASLGRNKRGWPSGHFHEKWADSCRLVPLANGFAIAIGPIQVHGRLVGLNGLLTDHTITPQTVDRLAIPIDPLAANKVPSDFKGQALFLMKTPKGAYLCIKTGKGENAPVVFLFKLMTSVDQAGRPQLLPTEDRINTTLKSALNNHWSKN